jgi:hypothetical protein
MIDGDPFQRFRIPANRRDRGTVELELRGLVRLARALREEVGTPFRVPWRARVAALRRGFTSMAAVLYQLAEGDPALYMPDLVFALRGYKLNGFLNPVVGNKLVLARILASHDVPHPPVRAMVVHGRLHDADGSLGDDVGAALAALASRSSALVFRPDWSGGGEGVFFVRREAGVWSINGIAADLADVRALVAALDRYVVTEFVEQAAYAREIFPRTANTLRVLTLWDRNEGPFVAAAVHRFGTSRSAPIDNWHQGRGGLCTWVDCEAAVLGRSATLDEHLRLEWRDHHPETGRAIAGVAIPHLADTLAGIVRAARCLPGAPCIGWDVIVTDRGFSILEANSPPGLFVWQVHAPLLAEPRAARFFASRGIVRPMHAVT